MGHTWHHTKFWKPWSHWYRSYEPKQHEPFLVGVTPLCDPPKKFRKAYGYESNAGRPCSYTKRVRGFQVVSRWFKLRTRRIERLWFKRDLMRMGGGDE